MHNNIKHGEDHERHGEVNARTIENTTQTNAKTMQQLRRPHTIMENTMHKH